MHSEVVTGNVEMVLLGFIGQTGCNPGCRMASACPPPSSVPSLLSLQLSGVHWLKYLFWRDAFFFFHFLLTSNQPVFVFSSHSGVHTT